MNLLTTSIKNKLKNQMPRFFEKLRHTKSKLALHWCARPVYSSGVTRHKRNPQLIVSLTTYPARIRLVEQTIRSLLHQSLRADSVVLWLSEEPFPQKEGDLPESLLLLKKCGLVIDWCDNLKSYKKLIPSLQKYPNDIIVTADDDIIYWPSWLKVLYKEHLRHPTVVITHRCHKIILDQHGDPLPYLQWKLSNNCSIPSYSNFLLGGSGTLFTPNSLYKPDILNKSTFTNLAPTADDVWFWAMTILNGTPIMTCPQRNTAFTENPCVNQCDSLMVVNHNGGNDRQLRNVLEHYPQLKILLKEEWEQTQIP